MNCGGKQGLPAIEQDDSSITVRGGVANYGLTGAMNGGGLVAGPWHELQGRGNSLDA